MPDTTLNITVKTENADLLKLIDSLNAGTMTQAAYNKEIRNLKAAAVVGSQGLMDLKNVQEQVAQQTLTYTGQVKQSYFEVGAALRTQEAGEKGLTDTIRSARQERRMYMFAVREGITAITTATGAQGQFSKAMTDGASSVFGIKFALDMMGATLSKVALPVALLFGAWTILKELFSKSTEETKKLNDELKKQDETMTGLIENLQKLGKVTTDQLKNLYRVQIAGLETANKQTETKTGTMTGAGGWIGLLAPSLTRYDANKLNQPEQEANLKKISDLLLKIDALDKQDLETKKKAAQELKNQQKELEKSRQEAWSLAEAFRVLTNAAEPTKKKKNPIPFVDEAKPGKSFSDSLSEEFSKGEKSASQFTHVLDQGISHSTNLLAEGFAKAFGLGNSLAAKLLEQMLSIAAQMAETYALESIAMALTAGATGNIFTALGAMFGLASGGDVTTGGRLQFAANGANFNYGRLQNVIVGERGPELMQVGMNGVRVISNQNMGALNQMSQASRGGGGSQPSVTIINHFDKAGISTVVEQGDRINNRRRLK